jgi:hypothetical protein
MGMFINDQVLDRIAQRTEQIIVVARAIAKAQMSESGANNDAIVLQIAQMIASREAAELVGYEVSSASKTGK